MLSSPRATDLERISADELRKHFLIEDLFSAGRVRLVYTGLDRLITGGIYLKRKPNSRRSVN